MAKIRTLTQLQAALDAQMSWRIREISDFRIATKAQSLSSRTFIRAGIALVYAHWEGFIKATSRDYLNYVANQGHVYRELKTCFAVFGLKGRLEPLTSGKRARSNIEAFDFVLAEMDKPAKLSLPSMIDTESNLTSRVFANIAVSLDISLSSYETKFHLIDESLVGRRNKVAHGEYLDLPAADFVILTDEVLELMRTFKTDIENAASLQSYRRSVGPALQGVPVSP